VLRAVEINPQSGSAHRWAAEILQLLGRPEEAIPHARAALLVGPRSAQAHADLGTALAMIGRFDEALSELRTALRLDPEQAQPAMRAALLLATRPGASPGDADEAVGLARRAVKLTGAQDAAALETLAAALAAAGRFGDAVAEQGRAVALIPAGPAAEDARATLARYRAGQPLRLDVPARAPAP
jgi:spermidine synthase